MTSELLERTIGDPPAGRSRGDLLRSIVLSFLLVFVAYLSSGVSDYGDGYLALPTAHSLLYDGDLDLQEFSETEFFQKHYGITRVGDRDVDYFPWLTAVFATPALAGWDLLSTIGVTTNSEELIRDGRVGMLQILTASVITAAAAVQLGLVTMQLFALQHARLARRRDAGDGAERAAPAWLEPSRRRALPVFSLVIGLGTTLWSTASRAMWQHGPSVLLCASALLCVLTLLGAEDPRRQARLGVAAGALGGLAYWVRPTNLVLCIVLIALVFLRRRPALVPLLATMLAVQVLVVAANLAMLGQAVPPYFSAGRVAWHAQLPEAVAANLVSPARGLLVFSPFVIMAALVFLPGRWSRLGADLRAVMTACALGAVGYLLAVSAYGEKWWAGHSFGPRFMTEALVLLAPVALFVMFGPRPTSPRARIGDRGFRVLCVALIALSVLPHLQSAQMRGVRCWNRAPVNIDDDPSRVWKLDRPLVVEGSRLLINGEAAEAAGRDCAA